MLLRKLFGWVVKDHPDNARHGSWWLTGAILALGLSISIPFGWTTIGIWYECRKPLPVDVIVELCFTGLVTILGLLIFLAALIEAVAKAWASLTRLSVIPVI